MRSPKALPLLLTLFSVIPAVAADGGVVLAKGHRFQAEVAHTDMDRARGLMYRPSLAKDHCMFFLYEEDGYHAIWMKNCLISLDVAWVKADGTILELAENVPPCSPMVGDDCPTYGGRVPTRNFVEFPVGTFKSIGLKKGDRLGWELSLDSGQTLVGGAVEAPEKPHHKRR
nr:DUF192 domain-containing protein [uncultured Holophaga sp.]